MTKDLKPIQTGGMCHAWQSPDGTFKHVLLKLDLSCEPDPYPGVVIIADEHCMHAVASAVKSLRKELKQKMAGAPPKSVAYWSLQQDEAELTRILSGLTERPTFYG